MAKGKITLSQALPYILIIGGALGVLASSMLTLDKIHELENPNFKPICNINPLLSCVSVTNSPQAQVFFGIPNMLYGMAGFAVVLTIGAALLAGAQYKRWFWRSMSVGLALALLFIFWLISQSIYVIGALCLYCMLVWVVTAMLFWYTTLYNLQQGYLPYVWRFKRFINALLSYHDITLVSFYTLIALLIVQHFWAYFSFFL